MLCLESFRTFHYEGIAKRSKTLHGLGLVANEDAGLAVGVVEVGLALWAVEEGGYELAGCFGVRGDRNFEGIDCWILQGCNLADQVEGKVFGDAMDLFVVSMLLSI